jgi:hypothetical protein
MDRYYLENLEIAPEVAFNDRQLDPEVVPQVVGKLVQELNESLSPRKPTFAGHNFYIAVRDEELTGVVALNRPVSVHGHVIPPGGERPLDPRAATRSLAA